MLFECRGHRQQQAPDVNDQVRLTRALVRFKCRCGGNQSRDWPDRQIRHPKLQERSNASSYQGLCTLPLFVGCADTCACRHPHSQQKAAMALWPTSLCKKTLGSASTAQISKALAPLLLQVPPMGNLQATSGRTAAVLAGPAAAPTPAACSGGCTTEGCCCEALGPTPSSSAAGAAGPYLAKACRQLLLSQLAVLLAQMTCTAA